MGPESFVGRNAVVAFRHQLLARALVAESGLSGLSIWSTGPWHWHDDDLECNWNSVWKQRLLAKVTVELGCVISLRLRRDRNCFAQHRGRWSNCIVQLLRLLPVLIPGRCSTTATVAIASAITAARSVPEAGLEALVDGE